MGAYVHSIAQPSLETMFIRLQKIPLLHFRFLSPKAVPPQAFYSTHIVAGDNPILVRDFIHSSLYHPIHGYFSTKSRSVGVLPSSIQFNKLQGRMGYMRFLDDIYKQSDISWFTPVELFKPWYAHAIAEAIMRTANFSVPLKVSHSCFDIHTPKKLFLTIKYLRYMKLVEDQELVPRVYWIT